MRTARAVPGRARALLMGAVISVSLVVGPVIDLALPGASAATAADLTLIAGDPQVGASPSVLGNPALDTNLDGEQGIALDAAGNVLIADRADSTVDLLARSADNPGYALADAWHQGDLYLLAGDPGDPSAVAPSAAGTPARFTALDLPGGVSVDPEGNVLIADSADNEIEVLAENATPPPYDLDGATWKVGELYVLAGASAGLDGPEAVAADAVGGSFSGDLLVANTADNAIDLLAQAVENPGLPTLPSMLVRGVLYPLAGASALHAPDACGVAASQAALDGPDGLAVDLTGNVVFADRGNNEVEVLAVSIDNPGYVLGSGATWRQGDDYVIVGSGPHASTSSCPLAMSTPLAAPEGVAIDPAGDVLVADSANQVVRLLAVASSNPGYALGGAWAHGSTYIVAGGGTASSSVGGTLATSTALSEPSGVAIGGDGTVFIADAGTNLLSSLELAPAVATSLVATAGDGTVTLAWASPVTDGGASVSDYEIALYSGASPTPIAELNTASAASVDVVNGLDAGTSYGFTVAAVNAVGVATASNEVFATPAASLESPAPSSSPAVVTPSTGPAPVGVGDTAANGVPARTTKVVKSPAIRLGAPSAPVNATGVLLALACTGSCQGVAELLQTQSVALSGHHVLETEVLAEASYRLASAAPTRVRLLLTTAGRRALLSTQRALVVDEVLTVRGGKTSSGRVRLVPPKPHVATRSTAHVVGVRGLPQRIG